MSACPASLMLALEGEDYPEPHPCEKREGHDGLHGSLAGVQWQEVR